jgi:hypothetical protein
VLLPAGTLHGSLDVDAASSLLVAADDGHTVLDGSRGRSTWPGPAQVAELAVRRALGESHLDAIDVAEHRATAEHAWSTTVQHRDGRRWQVGVVSAPTDLQRAESCAKGLKPLRRWTWEVDELLVR